MVLQLRAHGLRKGDEQPPPIPNRSVAQFTFFYTVVTSEELECQIKEDTTEPKLTSQDISHIAYVPHLTLTRIQNWSGTTD